MIHHRGNTEGHRGILRESLCCLRASVVKNLRYDDVPFIAYYFLIPPTNAAPDFQRWRVEGPTRATMNLTEAATNPIMIQGDHGPVALRNIY